MKNLFFIATFVCIQALLSSCSNEQAKNTDTAKDDTTEAATQESTTPKECTYSVNTNKTVVQWTAYKTSAKIAVKGVFENIAINAKKGVKNPTELLKGTMFEINPNSVNSNDETRDKKLVNSFFNKLAGEMAGEFKEFTGDDTNGSGIIDMRWNTLRTLKPYQYKLVKDTIFITTSFDLNNWKAEDALSELNIVCKEKHTGPDGKAVTGSMIDVMVKVVLSKNCF